MTPYTNFERYAPEFLSKRNEAWEHVMFTPLLNVHETWVHIEVSLAPSSKPCDESRGDGYGAAFARGRRFVSSDPCAMASSFKSTKTTSSTLESDERLFVRRQIRHRHWTGYEQRFVLSGRLGSTLSAPPAMGQESQHVHHAWTMVRSCIRQIYQFLSMLLFVWEVLSHNKFILSIARFKD
jgi:hypothetical protein